MDGRVLAVPDSPWIRKPSISSWENLWPDSWHVGFGFDFLTLRNSAPEIPRGLDVAVTLLGSLDQRRLTVCAWNDH